MLKDMYSTIGDCTELCDDLIIKIEELERKILKSEIIFVDDYVYYADKDIFEKETGLSQNCHVIMLMSENARKLWCKISFI